jgi:quercetin dioxygenase-like cupin family protein
MIVSNISKFTGGWFIGNFTPSLLKTEEFEAAHHFYKKGFKGTPHTHKASTEYNYILSGKLIASNQILSSGDIFIYEKNDISDVSFIEDTNLIIIKTPSIPNDKFTEEK